MITWQHALLLAGAAALAGAINSVAGGGTMLTFPALLAAGFVSKVANATNTVALWPGQVSSFWGYREEIGHGARTLIPLGVIGLVGGIAGAEMLVVTPPAIFDRIIPFLMLTATLILLLQEPLARWQKRRLASAAAARSAAPGGDAVAETDRGGGDTIRLNVPIALFLLAVAVYGGYFGAGIGILTLAAFGLMGMTNIHRMNGIKALFTLGINGVAAVVFMAQGMVDWPSAGVMAVGAVFGGWAGAGIARRIGQKNVRMIVIGIGFFLTVSLLLKLRR